MLSAALMILMLAIVLSTVGQLASDSADLTPSGIVRSVARGARLVARAGVQRPEAARG